MLSNPRVAYQLHPDHKYVHVVEASQITLNSNDKMRVITEDNEAPYVWNFVHESTPIGVHTLEGFNAELYANVIW